MPWARIDDGFDDHPKVLWLLEHDDGAAAIGLWTLCLTWAHRNTRKKAKTPGRLPLSLPRRYLGVLGRDAAKLLVEAGLWEPAEDGWQIHDFNQYLPTAETSEARSEAGKRGAAARWAKRSEAAGSDGNLPPSDSKLPQDRMANDGNAIAADSSGMAPEASEGDQVPHSAGRLSGDGKLSSSDSNEPSGDSNPMASDGSRAPARRAISKEIAPVPGPIPGPVGGVQGGNAAQAPPKPKRATRIPDDFAVTPEMAAWARDNVPGLIAAGRGKRETDKFRNYWQAKSGRDATKHDWVATWRNWMLKAEEDLSPGSPGPGGRPPVDPRDEWKRNRS